MSRKVADHDHVSVFIITENTGGEPVTTPVTTMKIDDMMTVEPGAKKSDLVAMMTVAPGVSVCVKLGYGEQEEEDKIVLSKH